jgi:hypothetical protein
MTCGSSEPLVTAVTAAPTRPLRHEPSADRARRYPSHPCTTVSLCGRCASAWGLRAEGALSTMGTVGSVLSGC